MLSKNSVLEKQKDIGFFFSAISLKNGVVKFNSFNIRQANLMGFTLIEFVVSLSIVALMSGIFLTNYHATNKRSELNVTVQKLVSDMRLAQNYSLGSKEYGSDVPVGGWGLYFNRISSPESYIIFADSDGNMEYNSGESDVEKGGRIISLPTEISIKDIDIGHTTNFVNLTFLPPDPATNIWHGHNHSLMRITLEESGGLTKVVEVNFFGLIEVKE